MNDDLRILFEILEGRDQEVTGLVATGKCSEEERDQMKKLSREKPDLIPALVMETHALRQSDE